MFSFVPGLEMVTNRMFQNVCNGDMLSLKDHCLLEHSVCDHSTKTWVNALFFYMSGLQDFLLSHWVHSFSMVTFDLQVHYNLTRSKPSKPNKHRDQSNFSSDFLFRQSLSLVNFATDDI